MAMTTVKRVWIAAVSASAVCASVASTCGEPEPDLLQQWQDEAKNHGAMGKSGSFHLNGAATLAGPSQKALTLTAPFFAPNGLHVNDVDLGATGTGRVNCNPTAISSGSIEGAFALQTDSQADGSDPVVQVTGDAQGSAPRADALVVDDGTLCALVLDDASTVALTGSLTLSGTLDASYLPLAMPAIEVDVKELAIGGSATGTASVGKKDINDATAVFGVDAHATFSASGVDGTGRITQVLTTDGVGLPSDVELYCPDLEDEDGVVRIPKDTVASVVIDYRERGYDADALLASVAMTGHDKDAVQVAVDPPQGAVATLIGAINDAGAGAPIVALAVIAVLPAAIIVDVIDSIFGGSDPPAPIPLPSWIHAGEVGTFTVVVAAGSKGDHDATLVIGGQNFDTLKLHLKWESYDPNDE